MTEILKPVGNGYFNEKNLGIVCIEKPLIMIGEEISFYPYDFRSVDIDIGIDFDLKWIRHKSIILRHIDENIVLHTLSSESSIFEKTPWT